MSKPFEILKQAFLIVSLSGFLLPLHAQTSIEIEDTRNVASAPENYSRRFKPSFKHSSTLGIPEGGTEYYTVLGFRGWLDNTGGKAHELAFGNSSDIYIRSGLTESWQNWRKVIVENPGTDGSTIRIGNGNAPFNLNVPVGSPTGGYNIDFLTWRDVVPDQVGARIRAERINNYHPGSALVQSMDLAFYTSAGGIQSDLSERLRIKSDGTVGIGTMNPMGFKLAVNGSIRAKEVKVDNTNWPDYVFAASYNLPELENLESYILQHKHLPEIPSAAEVKQNGVNLGEMHAKLLQKIEELTLYIINQDKAMKEMKSRLDNLTRNDRQDKSR